MSSTPFVPVLMALAAGCASPARDEPAGETPARFQGEPVVAHLEVGGVT